MFSSINIYNANIYKNSWKQHYYLTQSLLSDKDIVSTIKYIIENDYVGILEILFAINNTKGNRTIYGFTNLNREFIVPLHYAITQDSIFCFKFLYIKAVKEIEDHKDKYFFDYTCLQDAFIYDSHNIIEYLNKEKISFIPNIPDYFDAHKTLFSIFKNNCPYCLKYIDINSFDITDVLHYISFFGDVHNFLQKKNEPFSQFLFKKQLSPKELFDIKNYFSERNNHKIVKLINKYTSHFGEFAH